METLKPKNWENIYCLKHKDMETLKAKNWEKIYLTNTNKTTMKCFKTNINTLREIRKMSTTSGAGKSGQPLVKEWN